MKNTYNDLMKKTSGVKIKNEIYKKDCNIVNTAVYYFFDLAV